MNAREARVRTDIKISGQSREASLRQLEVKYKDAINETYRQIADSVNNMQYTCILDFENDDVGRESAYVLLHNLRKMGYAVESTFHRSNEDKPYDFDILRLEVDWNDA